MKSSHLLSFTLGVIVTAVSVSAVSYVNALNDKAITACADRKTGVMRYIDKGRCRRTEQALTWNQIGPQGLTGATGAQGPQGQTGATGAQGPQGQTGATGAQGPQGQTGATGPSAPNGFTTRNVCGANGNSPCSIGSLGPGGGTVFYIDIANRIADFDYLEVAPTDASIGVLWAATTATCGLTQNASCQSSFLTTSGEALNYVEIGSGRAATAAIVSRHDAGNISKSLYAAGVADSYFTATASDWWLPSFEELREVCKFALNVSLEETDCSAFEGSPTLRSGFSPRDYWSSSEFFNGSGVWIQAFSEGSYGSGSKSGPNNAVLPVRGF
jgi:hypothetical protein